MKKIIDTRSIGETLAEGYDILIGENLMYYVAKFPIIISYIPEIGILMRLEQIRRGKEEFPQGQIRRFLSALRGKSGRRLEAISY